MFWLLLFVIFLAVIAAVLFWLLQTISIKNNFVALSFAAKADLFHYLSAPTHLTEYHPAFVKVTDVKQEEETTTCTVEENLGLLGKVRIPVKVSAFSDVPSPTSPSIRFEFLNKDIRVTVKLVISDNGEDKIPEKSKIEAAVSVEGLRVITLLLSNNFTRKWIAALNNVKSILKQ